MIKLPRNKIVGLVAGLVGCFLVIVAVALFLFNPFLLKTVYQLASDNENYSSDNLDENDLIEEIEVGKIKAAVVSHHLLAHQYIEQMFVLLAKQDIDRLVILGPNHFELGRGKILSTDQMMNGISVDEQIVRNLAVGSQLEIDVQVLAEEHSIISLLDFVKSYLIDVQIVPIIFSNTLNLVEIENFSQQLFEQIDELDQSNGFNKKTVVLASIDFSHYLNSAQAQEKDKVTYQAIINHDYKQIMKMNNDYLDSPPAMVTLLKLTKLLNQSQAGTQAQKNIVQNQNNKPQPTIIKHINSGETLNEPFIECTSYFFMIYN